MKKRLLILMGALAVLLAVAVPAFAQQESPEAGGEISVTGVVEDLGSSALPPYGLRDEATGGVYYLASDDVDFDALVGQRITAYGTPEEVVRSVVLNVTRVEPADGPPPGPPPGEDTATLSFELTVKGTPPEGTRFFGSAVGEGGPGTPLTDPDGDGVYTASIDVPRFPPGPRPVPPGAEPISLEVRILQENGGSIEVIRDFGLVALDGDKEFKAKVNFKKNRGGATTPNPGSGGTTDPTNPETGEDVNGDGSINEADGEVAASVSDAAREAAGETGGRTLPVTGGVTLLPLFAGSTGLLLAAGVLLVRRTTR